MIQLPPGFNISAFISDYSKVGVFLVTLASIFVTIQVIRKLSNKI